MMYVHHFNEALHMVLVAMKMIIFNNGRNSQISTICHHFGQLGLNWVDKMRQQVFGGFIQIGSDMMSRCADESMDIQVRVLLVCHSVILARDIKIKNWPSKEH